MAGKRVRVEIKSQDGTLRKYHNQLGALGIDKARVAMSRALNRTASVAHTAVRKALAAQTSIPAGIIRGQVKLKKSAQQGSGPLEAVIYATGSEIPLEKFKARQTPDGASAIVWGRRQVYQGTFGAPGDNPNVVSKLGGAIYHRTSKSRLPIERTYGPSIPKEMIKDETLKTFESMVDERLADRLAHEIARMLPG